MVKIAGMCDSRMAMIATKCFMLKSSLGQVSITPQKFGGACSICFVCFVATHSLFCTVNELWMSLLKMLGFSASFVCHN